MKEVYVVFGYDRYNYMSGEKCWFSSAEIFQMHIRFLEVFEDREKAVNFFRKKVIETVKGYDLLDGLEKENGDELFVDESEEEDRSMTINYQEEDGNLFWSINVEDECEYLPPDIRLVVRNIK